MLHKLKFTVAATCLLATACFVILWMRSLKQWDNVIYAGTTIGMLEAGSSDGMLSLCHAHSEEYQSPEGSDRLGIHLMATKRNRINVDRVALLRWPRHRSDLGSNSVSIPFWLLIALSGGIGSPLLLIRQPFRFSLRTLAIAATLIVVTLGMGVTASRLALD